MRRLIIFLLVTFVFPVLVYAQTFENGKIEVFISTHAELLAENYVLETEIVRFINGSNTTLDIAVQELRAGSIHDQNPIKQAISDAAGRGVQVRMVVEASYLKSGSDNLKTFLEFFNAENILIRADHNPKIFHNKFIVRDNGTGTAALLTGSTNFTDTGTRRNYNHIIVTHFKGERKTYFEILDRYQAEFDEILSGTFGNRQPDQEVKTYRIGNTRITPLFSPDNDPDDVLLKTVLSAAETLDVMMFTFGSNSPLLAGVINRFNAVKFVDRRPTDEKKVDVRVAFESQQSRYWSAYPALKKLGVAVKLERNSPKLHHKVGIIDNKKVILGSYNWTLSANDDNDENILIVGNQEIANMFTNAFNELWAGVLSE